VEVRIRLGGGIARFAPSLLTLWLSDGATVDDLYAQLARSHPDLGPALRSALPVHQVPRGGRRPPPAPRCRARRRARGSCCWSRRRPRPRKAARTRAPRWRPSGTPSRCRPPRPGQKTLGELFDGRSQLLVYHFMFGPEWSEGCPVCSYWADDFDGGIVHLRHRDVTMLCASRAPIERLQAYKRRMGWSFPWVSSGRSEFSYDYGVSVPGLDAGASQPEMERPGPETPNLAAYDFTKKPFGAENPGLSAFASTKASSTTPTRATRGASTHSTPPINYSTGRPTDATRTPSHCRSRGSAATTNTRTPPAPRAQDEHPRRRPRASRRRQPGLGPAGVWQ
jgi:hypothetical protein